MNPPDPAPRHCVSTHLHEQAAFNAIVWSRRCRSKAHAWDFERGILQQLRADSGKWEHPITSGLQLSIYSDGSIERLPEVGNLSESSGGVWFKESA
jgi:hypothetical protein